MTALSSDRHRLICPALKPGEHSSSGRRGWPSARLAHFWLRGRKQTFTLSLFAGSLSPPTDGFVAGADPLLRRFLIGAAPLHLAKNALALQFSFQGA